jgi:hypothetical protein
MDDSSRSLSFNALEPFASRKSNPSVNKLAKAYQFDFVREGGTSIVGIATWVTKGAYRDWLESGDGSIGFKVSRSPTENTQNESEYRFWLGNLVIRDHCPPTHGLFVVEALIHGGEKAMLSILVQDKAGLSMGELLRRTCQGDASFLPDALLQVHSWWLMMLQLTDALSASRLTWDQDFHLENSCLSLCGRKMFWVDWADCSQSRATRVVTMRRALKKLELYCTEPHGSWLIGSWKRYHLQLFVKLRETLETSFMSDLPLPDHWYDIPMNDVLNHFGGSTVHIPVVSSAAHAAVPGAQEHAAVAKVSIAEEEVSVVPAVAALVPLLQVHSLQRNVLGIPIDSPLLKRQRVFVDGKDSAVGCAANHVVPVKPTAVAIPASPAESVVSAAEPRVCFDALSLSVGSTAAPSAAHLVAPNEEESVGLASALACLHVRGVQSDVSRVQAVPVLRRRTRQRVSADSAVAGVAEQAFSVKQGAAADASAADVEASAVASRKLPVAGSVLLVLSYQFASMLEDYRTSVGLEDGIVFRVLRSGCLPCGGTFLCVKFAS